ncbi:Hpt domain-containing protein, partial [Methylobacterium crusticola]
MSDLVAEFVVEARELVQSATEDLLVLEAAPADAAALDRVFRAFHTLKGSVGLFDFPPFLAVLHAAEDGFSAVRAGTLAVGAALIDLSLETLDAAALWTDAVAASGRLPPGVEADASRLTGRYRALLGRPSGPAAA